MTMTIHINGTPIDIGDRFKLSARKLLELAKYHGAMPHKDYDVDNCNLFGRNTKKHYKHNTAVYFRHEQHFLMIPAGPATAQ